MQLLIVRNRIINLANVTTVRRFVPGDWHPNPKKKGDVIDFHEIWFEFNTFFSSPSSVQLRYQSKEDQDLEWDYIIRTMDAPHCLWQSSPKDRDD
jgi:hypothetical protein